MRVGSKDWAVEQMLDGKVVCARVPSIASRGLLRHEYRIKGGQFWRAWNGATYWMAEGLALPTEARAELVKFEIVPEDKQTPWTVCNEVMALTQEEYARAGSVSEEFVRELCARFGYEP